MCELRLLLLLLLRLALQENVAMTCGSTKNIVLWISCQL